MTDIYAQGAAYIKCLPKFRGARPVGKHPALAAPFGCTPRIHRVSGATLDLLLLPAITGGTLSTHYNPANGATEYRDAGRLLAVTVGSHHFAEVLP